MDCGADGGGAVFCVPVFWLDDGFLPAEVTFCARALVERPLPLLVNELARDLGRPRALGLSTRDEGCANTLSDVFICEFMCLTGMCVFACGIWLEDWVPSDPELQC